MLDRFYVWVDNEGWIQWNEESMKFINISSNFMGEDEYEFEYKGKTYTSKMISR